MQRGALGNILEVGYERVWRGLVAEKIRKQVADNELPVFCKTASCPYAHMGKEERVWQMKPADNPHGFPTEIELDLPDSHCNVGGLKPDSKNPACLMCERHLYGVVQEDKVDEICHVIKPYIKYINKFHIQGIAEAFWKDKVFDIFDILDMQKYKKQVVISTTTNATILTKGRREKWLDYPRSSLTFSIDAATADTFKLIRRWDAFDKVCENIRHYCKERKKGRQVAGIHNNLNLLNVNEGRQMVELAADLGVDFVDFNPTYGIQEICVNKQNVHIFQKAQEEIRQASIKAGVKVTFMRDLTLGLDVPEEPELIQITPRTVGIISEKLDVNREAIYDLVEENKDWVQMEPVKLY